MSPASRTTTVSGTRPGATGRDRARVPLYRAAGKPQALVFRSRVDNKTSARTSSGIDMAAALRLSRRALRSHVERRSALGDMVRAVNTTFDPHKIADLILDRAATWVPAPCWAVVTADLSGQLSVLADRGLTPDMGQAVRVVADWVMQRGEEFVAADLRSDRRATDPTVGAVVAFPLSSRGRRIGALIGFDPQASSREPRLAQSHLRGVNALLEPASVALDSALLLKRAEALSVTDDLTNLYNSRYLNLTLRRETKRAIRAGHPLSVLFIDLDGFKRVNDAHGHLCGSRALVEAAAVLRGNARETDVVARFGGDEFAVVLPDTGAEGALAVGERMRSRLAEHRFLAAEGLELALTASVGVATLPDVAASAEELVQAADSAMYRAKESGKNGVLAAPAPADTDHSAR